MNYRFLQIHNLTSYDHALVNRDDAGFAKRSTFGGIPRTRISRQCQKFHIRKHGGQNSLSELGLDMAVRSRVTFERYLYQPLVETHDVDPRTARLIAAGLSQIVTKGIPKGKEAKKLSLIHI